MSSYPKHIAYRRREGGKSFHAVARNEDEEESVRRMIDERDYVVAVSQHVSGMTDDEYAQFVKLKDLGVQLGTGRRRGRTDVRDDQQELSF